jgi:hypothetical protein
LKCPENPHKSILIPYEKEIMSLRRHRPPVTYARIAELLRQKHNLVIQPPAIFKFLKVRSHGRKVFGYARNVASEKPSQAPSSSTLQPAKPNPGPPKPAFEFTYSQRYNLHRLPPEEAAARRKKLEAEGH